ncbi:MAG: flagellar basal body P-ring protein FlgI [Proteobacteria bacterium]|nr:flagellar basal body P-ring protein FlgI [Pseudomonadota bacterium]
MVMVLLMSGTAHAASRIKDVVTVEGVRENMLIGYGLVVGLNGTGDKLTNSAFTEKSLVAFLERLGINTRGDALKTKNVAAVTVTAQLPPFARAGSKVDVTVSTMGDARSLQGGVLLATTLMGADGEVYAIAQGALATSGFTAGGNSGSSISKGVPTGTVKVTVPKDYVGTSTSMLSEIEQLSVVPDQVAKVVIDEASGTIVMGENVRIDTVAIAQGNLVVRIQEALAVSQPGALSGDNATTVVTPQSAVSVDEGSGNRMAVMPSGTTLRELVAGLNALGVGPRDLISILQTIKSAGALQAEIETR